jgi:hypothetical protein
MGDDIVLTGETAEQTGVAELLAGLITETLRRPLKGLREPLLFHRVDRAVPHVSIPILPGVSNPDASDSVN